MLTREENERLTRVGRSTPMGELVRRFWLPFLLTADLSEPDGAPVRVTLLGERLLAFRDTSGRIGLIDRACAHRSLTFFSAATKRTACAAPTMAGSTTWTAGVWICRPKMRRVLSKKTSSSPPIRCASGRESCGPTWDRKNKLQSCRNLSGPGFRTDTDLFLGTSSTTTSFRRSTVASTPSIRSFSIAHWTRIAGLVNCRNGQT